MTFWQGVLVLVASVLTTLFCLWVIGNRAEKNKRPLELRCAYCDTPLQHVTGFYDIPNFYKIKPCQVCIDSALAIGKAGKIT